MLMPNQLKKPSMHFLEVEDIRSLRVQAEPPKTEAQIEREQLEEVIRADEESKKWEKVTDEQREKTIRCLFKILDYQLSNVKEQSKDIENHYKQVDKQLKEFEKVLKDEENKGIMDGVKAKIKDAKKKAEEYDQIFDPNQLFNVADIIVENKLLIDRVDAILGRQEKSNIYDLPSRTDVSGISILETGRQGENKSALTLAEEEELSELS